MRLKPQIDERRSERYAVTIIAGFKAGDGIIVCADTQETIAHISKRNVPKVRFEPDSFHSHLLREGLGDLAVAFCGAANNGPFIDKIVDTAWKNAQMSTSLDQACQTIEESIKRTYEEFGLIYQAGYCPEAELLYGVKMAGASRLFSALGPVVVEKDAYSTGGAGYYMADFLASRMYSKSLTVHQCAILAAYILFQAKEHVDGCGGESHIAVLRHEGQCGMAGRELVEKITQVLKYADQSVGQIILEMADAHVDQEKFKADGMQMVDVLTLLREGELPKTGRLTIGDRIAGITERDALGIIKKPKRRWKISKQLDPQKSEPEP